MMDMGIIDLNITSDSSADDHQYVTSSQQRLSNFVCDMDRIIIAYVYGEVLVGEHVEPIWQVRYSF